MAMNLAPAGSPRHAPRPDPDGKIVWEAKTAHLDPAGKEVWRPTNDDLPGQPIDDACGVQRQHGVRQLQRQAGPGQADRSDPGQGRRLDAHRRPEGRHPPLPNPRRRRQTRPDPAAARGSGGGLQRVVFGSAAGELPASGPREWAVPTRNGTAYPVPALETSPRLAFPVAGWNSPLTWAARPDSPAAEPKITRSQLFAAVTPAGCRGGTP